MSDEASDRHEARLAMLDLRMRRRSCDRGGDDPAMAGVERPGKERRPADGPDVDMRRGDREMVPAGLDGSPRW
jgi:hypothetical protein